MAENKGKQGWIGRYYKLPPATLESIEEIKTATGLSGTRIIIEAIKKTKSTLIKKNSIT